MRRCNYSDEGEEARREKSRLREDKEYKGMGRCVRGFYHAEEGSEAGKRRKALD